MRSTADRGFEDLEDFDLGLSFVLPVVRPPDFRPPEVRPVFGFVEDTIFFRGFAFACIGFAGARIVPFGDFLAGALRRFAPLDSDASPLFDFASAAALNFAWLCGLDASAGTWSGRTAMPEVYPLTRFRALAMHLDSQRT